MASIDELLKILVQVISRTTGRKTLIADFQKRVWKDRQFRSPPWIGEILSQLAYDLDYYEPDVEWRREDPSFYGDDRLEREVAAALDKLRAGGIDIPRAP